MLKSNTEFPDRAGENKTLKPDQHVNRFKDLKWRKKSEEFKQMVEFIKVKKVTGKEEKIKSNDLIIVEFIGSVFEFSSVFRI